MEHPSWRLHQARTLHRRRVYDTPDMALNQRLAWLRVRDEGNRTTLSYKRRLSQDVGGVEECEIVVSDWAQTCALLEALGYRVKAEQENWRTTWLHSGGAQATLDEWPWLQPFLEIEAQTAQAVYHAAHTLDLGVHLATAGTAEAAYLRAYNLPDTFEMRTTISSGRLNFSDRPTWLSGGNAS